MMAPMPGSHDDSLLRPIASQITAIHLLPGSCIHRLPAQARVIWGRWRTMECPFRYASTLAKLDVRLCVCRYECQ